MVIKMNRIENYEQEEVEVKCPEPKKEPKPKMYKYKIEVNTYDLRNPIINEILRRDNKATFKVRSKWAFRVKTRLSENELLYILSKDKDNPFIFKKIWFM